MQLPGFLAKLTNAQAFADGGVPTFGDGLQGIGHSMMEHYRRNSGIAKPQMPMPSAVAGQGAPRPGPATIAPMDLGQVNMPSFAPQAQIAQQQPWGLPLPLVMQMMSGAR